jgi:ribonuclease BN (tRNA processing enzyme)
MQIAHCVMSRSVYALLCVLLLSSTTLAGAESNSDTVKVITLGTGGGPLVRLKRAQSATAVVIGDTVYVVDAGEGTLRQLAAAGLAMSSVRAVFITHHHLDHTADLPSLLGLRWMTTVSTPLLLHGPAGLEQIVEGFRVAAQPAIDADFTRSAGPLAAVTVREIERPGLIFEDARVRVLAAENSHYHAPLVDPAKRPRSYAYRIETAHGVVVFTGDTGPSEAVMQLARDADLLVSEVIDLDATLRVTERLAAHLSAEQRASLMAHLAQDHLTPEQVGELAKAARVKQLVLSHLAPGLDSESSTDGYSAGVRRSYHGPVTVAEDLMVFTLSAKRTR